MVTAERFDLRHLSPAAAAVAKNDDDAARVHNIEGGRWIGYPKAVEGLNRLETLIAWPTRSRMPNLLVVAPSNNGKTEILEQFCRRHVGRSTADVEVIDILKIEMPPGPTPQAFYLAILKELGVPPRKYPRVAELEQLVIQILKDTGVRILIVDELHNILDAPTNYRRRFLNIIRYLGNVLKIPIVGAGTRDAYLAIRSDPQLENRFEPFVLPLWTNGAETLALLASFAKMFPLRRPAEIVSGDMAQYLLARSEGSIGELSKLLTEAAIAAVISGEESLNRRTLELAAYKGPSVRRHEFEGAPG